MAKLYVQNAVPVLVSTASLAVSASISGSVIAHGYTALVGMAWSNASATEGSGSGVHITQSSNYGVTWDLVSASWGITASAASSASAPIYGNAVKIQVWNGATAASLFRTAWYLRPV